MQRTMRTILDLERPTNADRVWLDPPSPHTLIQRIAVGDSAALDALYALYSRQLLSYLIGQLTDPPACRRSAARCDARRLEKCGAFSGQ